ncbi:MAG: efflux RND transporter periplasmic adaptor subunit [Spirochaetota bacterium]|jgi:multidrug efflux pump subunit AcrA (membrane-fusion protein)|nr:efflux RND transporter periplasmic adaptor subunit [Spirochaetota bacterium]
MAFKITKTKVIVAVVLLIVAFIAFSRANKTQEQEGVKTVPVVIETVTNSAMAHRLFVNGEIKGLNQADIYPDVPGKVMELFVQEGQYVGAGQVVATIDRSQVGMIYMPATVTTPISGVVGKIYVERGRTVSPAVPIMFIADTRVVEGVLNIPEKDIGHYKLGQDAEIRTESHPGTVFKGYVSRISSVIDSLTRTLEVRITLVNTGNLLIPGNYADFSIKVKDIPDQVMIPYDTIIDTIERKEVFVVEEDESPLGGTIVNDDPQVPKTINLGTARHLVARERIITIGIRDGEYVQVLSGLVPGERIISLGKENVVDGIPVREVPKRTMEALEGKTHAPENGNDTEPAQTPDSPANDAE